MRRQLFNVLSAISLALCLATVALWVRSHWVCDEVEAQRLGFVSEEAFQSHVFTDGILPPEDSPGADAGYDSITIATRRDGFVIERDLPALTRTCKLYLPFEWSWHSYGKEYVRSAISTAESGRNPLAKLGLSFKFERFSYRIILPFWLLTAMTGVAPTAWLLRRRRHRERLLAGFCRKCGYDLRATPDRCPECGGGA